MIMLEVSLNGEVIANAGRNDLAVLNTIISAVGVLGDESTGTKTQKDDYDLYFTVGGLSSSNDDENGEHVRWLENENLSIGDVVIVRILDSDEADKPKKLKLANAELKEKELREHWEMAREYYFKHRENYEDTAC
jgi:hypothetical protein